MFNCDGHNQFNSVCSLRILAGSRVSIYKLKDQGGGFAEDVLVILKTIDQVVLYSLLVVVDKMPKKLKNHDDPCRLSTTARKTQTN